jgi:transposase
LGNENKRITELEILLKAALEENERLRAEIAVLKAEVAVLKKDSSNSSKPPSSDIVKPPKKQKGKGKQRIGAQKGHKQHLRKPFDAIEVDKIIHLTLETCPDCGGALQATGEVPKKHQQVELIEKPYIVIEYQQPRYFCNQCQCHHEPKLPKEVKRAGLFGHSLIALAAYMKGKCHLSYKTMQSFFSDVMSLNVSTGFLVKCIHKASKALAVPYNYLVEQLAKAEHLHSDETGFKENGKSCWTWCFRGKDNTVFHIALTRSSAVLEKLLSKDYNGIISSDFHSVYKKFKRISSHQ